MMHDEDQFQLGDETAEFMELGEKVLKESREKQSCERLERAVRDEMIEEADRSFDEDLGLSTGGMKRSNTEEEFLEKMAKRKHDMERTMIRAAIAHDIGIDIESDIMDGRDSELLNVITDVAMGNRESYNWLKRELYRPHEQPQDPIMVHEAPHVVINVSGDYYGSLHRD